jgi:hypothetical protein
MNATLETTKVTTTETVRRPSPVIDRPFGPPTIDPADLIGKRPASELTRLVFCTLLAIAACVAMIGIASQATTSPTGPDDAPPEVIVEFD